jgi:hypothetical protein
MAIEWIKPMRKGRLASINTNGLYVAIAKGGENRPDSLVFGIQKDVMKAMRWAIGDRVLLGHDSETGIFVLARHPEGYKLTPRSSRNRDEAVSKCVPATLKMAAPDFIDKAQLPLNLKLEECEADGLELRFFLG